MTKSRPLDPRLTSLLGSLRQRIRRYVVWDSLLAVAAVVLIAFWLGLMPQQTDQSRETGYLGSAALHLESAKPS